MAGVRRPTRRGALMVAAYLLLAVSTALAVREVENVRGRVHVVEGRVTIVERSPCSGLSASRCVDRLIDSLGARELRSLSRRLRLVAPSPVVSSLRARVRRASRRSGGGSRRRTARRRVRERSTRGSARTFLSPVPPPPVAAPAAPASILPRPPAPPSPPGRGRKLGRGNAKAKRANPGHGGPPPGQAKRRGGRVPPGQAKKARAGSPGRRP